MHDLPNDTDDKTESKYECLKCGEIIVSEDHPVDCPECEGGMVGRDEALE